MQVDRFDGEVFGDGKAAERVVKENPPEALVSRRAILLADGLYQEAHQLPIPGMAGLKGIDASYLVRLSSDLEPGVIQSAIAQLNARWECGTATLVTPGSILVKRER